MTALSKYLQVEGGRGLFTSSTMWIDDFRMQEFCIDQQSAAQA